MATVSRQGKENQLRGLCARMRSKESYVYAEMMGVIYFSIGPLIDHLFMGESEDIIIDISSEV